MRIGLLGGTFDPIHQGHIGVAQSVRENLDVHEVWFVPAGKPWMKQGSPVLPARHRKRMIELAIAQHEGFSMCSVELNKLGESYTVDTLRILREQINIEDELIFIIGADNLENFHRWRTPSVILEMATLAVVSRPGYEMAHAPELGALVTGPPPPILVIPEPVADIDSSTIRDRVSRGLPIQGLVPDAVIKYIELHGLYRES